VECFAALPVAVIAWAGLKAASLHLHLAADCADGVLQPPLGTGLQRKLQPHRADVIAVLEVVLVEDADLGEPEPPVKSNRRIVG
jgi:hypothetical protein